MFYLILLVCLTFFSYLCIFETINHVYGQQLSHIHKTTTKNPFILKKNEFSFTFFYSSFLLFHPSQFTFTNNHKPMSGRIFLSLFLVLKFILYWVLVSRAFLWLLKCFFWVKSELELFMGRCRKQWNYKVEFLFF